jgi:hypothetical protein
MELDRYLEDTRRQLLEAADAGGPEAVALGERLAGPLDAAIRLALQDALAAAAEEITLELAPGSVDVRLRGRELEFVVTVPPADRPGDDDRDHDAPHAGPIEPTPTPDGDDSPMARINVRMPDQLKGRVEQAAARDGLSVNAWLVRAATAAVERRAEAGPTERRLSVGQRYRGWAR